MESDTIRDVLARACVGTRIGEIRRLDAGRTSRQWVADTDEGPLLVKVPVRETDPEHQRHLVAATRLASETGVPTVRFRSVVADAEDLGTPVLVQEFLAGDPADQVWDELTAGERESLAVQLGTALGDLHSTPRPWFGDVLGRERRADVRTWLTDAVYARLRSAPEDIVPAGREALLAAFEVAIERIPADEPAALTHGDLWLPNLVVHRGRISGVLDFEHAAFGERFQDFGKLEEHLTRPHPDIRSALLMAYDARCPLPEDWESRIELSRALNALSMCVYFSRWQPELAPEYAAELEAWLTARA